MKKLLPPANEVWGEVIFSVACVKNSVHGGSVSEYAGIPPSLGADTPLEQTFPREQTPPLGADTPLEQTPLEQTTPAQCMLGDTVNKRAVSILLECNLVSGI